MNYRHVRVALVLAAFLAGVVLSVGVILVARDRPAAAAVGGPFRLTDQDGRTVTDDDLKGRTSLVFFGFTHCPDVCPTTLVKLAQARKTAHVQGLNVVFVTIDPARDTQQLVGLYVHAFDPDFVGLTGDEKTIDTMAHNFGVAVNKVDLPGGDYTMDHTAAVFLLNTRGQVAGIFTPPFDTPKLAQDLDRAAPYLSKS